MEDIQLFIQNDTGEYVEYTPPDPPAFKDTLPEDVRDSEYFQGIEDHSQLAKNYVELKQNLPKIPESEDAYEFEFPEEFNAHEQHLNDFKKLALETKLTPEQYQAIMKFEVERETALAQNMKADIEKTQQETEKKLKEDWGNNYEKNLETAKKVMLKFADDEFKQFVRDTRFGDNPQVIKFLAQIGESFSEDVLIGPKTRSNVYHRPKDESGRPMLSFPSMDKE